MPACFHFLHRASRLSINLAMFPFGSIFSIMFSIHTRGRKGEVFVINFIVTITIHHFYDWLTQCLIFTRKRCAIHINAASLSWLYSMCATTVTTPLFETHYYRWEWECVCKTLVFSHLPFDSQVNVKTVIRFMAFHSVLVWLFERYAPAEMHARRSCGTVFKHDRSKCSNFAKAQKYLFCMDACRKCTYQPSDYIYI